MLDGYPWSECRWLPLCPQNGNLHFKLASHYLPCHFKAELVFKGFRRPCKSPFTIKKKYSRLRCLLCVKVLVICFYLGWSGSILQFRPNIKKVGSKSWQLTYNLSLPSYTDSALKRELMYFFKGHLSLLYFDYKYPLKSLKKNM